MEKPHTGFDEWSEYATLVLWNEDVCRQAWQLAHVVTWNRGESCQNFAQKFARRDLKMTWMTRISRYSPPSFLYDSKSNMEWKRWNWESPTTLESDDVSFGSISEERWTNSHIWCRSSESEWIERMTPRRTYLNSLTSKKHISSARQIGS